MNIRSLAISIFDRVPNLGLALRDNRDRRAIRAMALKQVPGYNYSILGGNWFSAGVSGDGSSIHEAEELGIVADLLIDVDLLVDVGANGGLFSCLAASLGKRSIAFEPMPATAAILLRNIGENDFNHLIEVYQLAASDKVDIVPFYGRGQGASLVAGWGGHKSFDNVLVPTNTLDNVLYKRLAGEKFVLKIDVEGAELEVLKGAELLLSSRPPIIIENSVSRNHPDGFNPAFEEIFLKLWNLGYSAFIANSGRTPVTRAHLDDWISARRMDIGTENFLFIVPQNL